MSITAFLRRARSPLCAAALLGAAFPGTVPAAAKSVDDYLHGGAAKYIQGRLQEAGVEVEEGLRRHPDDSRLKALADQLKNMKDQQKKDQGGPSSQGGDENKEKQNDPSSGQDGQAGNQDKQDQDKEKEKKEQQGNEKDEDKGQGEDGKDQKPQPEEGKAGDSSGQAAAPAKPGEMSQDEAERLLNSYQDDEKREQKQMQKRHRDAVEVEEDW